MDTRLKSKKLASLHFQRNVLTGVGAILLLVVVLQTILLFLKNEKIIILPPEIKQSFWVEGNSFAPTYLQEQGMYFTHLLMDVSASNILAQGEVLLRYADSSVHESLKARLYKEEERLKKDSVSLNFMPIECEVFPKENAVEVTGDLNAFVAFKKISTHRETYRLEFSAKSGRLFLKSFTVLKSDNKDLSHYQDYAEEHAEDNGEEPSVGDSSTVSSSETSTITLPTK
jgi:conjugal transfer pilus assembly protein TraE